jgi:pimeloyl-ACP methyl ester carboxylesterase
MPPPPLQTGFIDLPLTRLHYAVAGRGQPLIMVPATISELHNWSSLVQFMAQKFTVYFFELPGHGGSTPFAAGFSAKQVVTTINDWVKRLKLNQFSLMGFSFGGILTLETLVCLSTKIDRIILLSPLISARALKFYRLKKEIMTLINHSLAVKPLQSLLLKIAHSRRWVDTLIALLAKFGQVETGGPRLAGLRAKLLSLPPSTLAVLTKQINIILTYELPAAKTFNQPAYFAMSVNDPLVDFAFTHAWLRHHFPHLTCHRFNFSYHQPPRPPAFAELVKHYQPFLEKIK